MESSFVCYSAVYFLLLCCIKTSTSHFGGLHYIPTTGNIAIGRSITSTSTCGESGQEYFCSTTDRGICDIVDPNSAHPADNMIDYSQDTWWQSQNNIDNVTIDIDFEKSFFFTYILISFKHLRPATMSIEKSNDGGLSYKPLMHYSADCEADFPSTDIPCTSLYSQSTPGYVIYQAITSISSDPDLTNTSQVDHFTVTNLRINLHSLFGNDPPGRYYAINHIEVYGWCFCNGHENRCLPSDVEEMTDGMVPSVCDCTNGTTGIHCDECEPQNRNGPWSTGFSPSIDLCQECECNGHTDTCVYNSSLGRGVCLECIDNTVGDTCDSCDEGYYRNDEVPITNSNTCIECQCNPIGVLAGPLCVAEDTALYIAGQCLCKPNVTGVRCDECEDGFLQFNDNNGSDNPCQSCSCPDCDSYTGRCPCDPSDTDPCCPFDEYLNVTCKSCDCNQIGSVEVCHLNGTCVCRPGMGGAKCDQCLDGYYNMTDSGCIPCGCDDNGSVNKTCDEYSGQCNCRGNVGGVKCDSCPLGSLGPLPPTSAKPCVECFCNGYSKQCKSEAGWYWAEAEDEFETSQSADQWQSSGDIEYNENVKNIRASISSNVDSSRLMVRLPATYFGDKRTSYGTNMDMIFKTPYANTAYLEILGDILRPRRKLRKTLELEEDAEHHQIPLIEEELTVTRYGYDTQKADQEDVREILTAVKTIKLVIFFDLSLPSESKYVNISYSKLPYAVKNSAHSNLVFPLSVAPVSEDCSCPVSRIGSICQSCSPPLFTNDPSNGNEFSSCVRCYCSGSPNICDPVTGQCINCINGTAGVNCEMCADDYYYRNSQCLPCNCPGGPTSTNQFGTCVSNDNVCNCPIGFTGDHCETCQTGFVGDPTHENGTCKMCLCTQNSGNDMNSCDNITGDCICDTGYIGEKCDLCDLGYYGDPLSHNCTDCECIAEGTVPGSCCDEGTGQCICHENVTGRDCGQCVPEHWHLSSGTGCRECGCLEIGSVNNDCEEANGNCVCKDGYLGRTCQDCDYGYWKMEDGTCSECNCQLLTSVSQACNMTTGVCTCHEGATGPKCDQCLPNITTGLLPYCELCDECSTRWNSPINELESAGTESIVKAENVTTTQVVHTEIEKGRQLVSTLFDLLRQIQELIQGSMITMLRTSVTGLNALLVANVNIAKNLLERIEIVLQEVDYTRMIVDTQLVRLENVESEFEHLKSLLGNISKEIGGFDFPGFQLYINIIEQAVLRSNESYGVTIETIIPAITQSNSNLNRFADKRNIFVLIRDEVLSLISTVEEILNEYEVVFEEANLRLCGGQLNSNDVCDDECGGVICDACGGDECGGSASQVFRANNISNAALEEVKRLRNMVLQEFDYLIQANDSSLESSITHRRIQLSAERAQLSINDLMINVSNLTDIVNTLLATRLPNIQQMELLQNTTLELNISQTPEEVLELLTAINNTIDLFPLLTNINETDLRMRAVRALELSLQANNTLNIVLSNITAVAEQIKRLRSEAIRLNGVMEQTSVDHEIVNRTNDQVEELLNDAELAIQRSKERVLYLNTTLVTVRESFERNRQQLLWVKGKADNVTMRAEELRNNSRRASDSVIGLNKTATRQLSSAKETLFNVTVLRDKLIQLRNSSHTQMLRSRGLLNLKECVISRQSHIRDDIHRIGVDLERLHNEIERNVARNTVCFRRSGTS